MFILAKGTSRHVIAIPSLGIVLKFARIRFDTFGSIRRAYRHNREIKEPLQKFLQRLVRLRKTLAIQIWNNWTNGMRDNWRERRYYKHSVFPFRLLLQPTHLSLLGIVNIQQYGAPLGNAASELGTRLYRQLFEIAEHALVMDGHHWSSAANFHIKDGALKVLDYGSERTQKILDTYGFEMFKRFDASSLS